MSEKTFIPDVSAWLKRGTFVTVGESERWSLFVQEFGDESAPGEKSVLLLHGFPESSYSFHKIIEGLLSIFDRVVAPDFLGFGFSDKPDNHHNSVLEQTDLLMEACAEIRLRCAHVIAHDMGDSVACELLARSVFDESRSFDVRSITLTNGGLVMDLAKPRLLQRLLKSHVLGPLVTYFAFRPLFGNQIHRANGSRRLSGDDVMHMWEILAVGGAHRRGYELIRYLDDREQYEQDRWLPALSKAADHDVPVNLVWGTADRVAPVAIAQHVQSTWTPNATLRLVDGGGHFLQLESPVDWLGAVAPLFKT